MDHVISEACDKGTILQRNYRKMTIKWSFSYNSFVKFHGTKIWEPQHDQVLSNMCYKEACYKGTVLYMLTTGMLQEKRMKIGRSVVHTGIQHGKG